MAVAAAKLHLHHQLIASIAAILFSLCLLPHYGVARSDTYPVLYSAFRGSYVPDVQEVSYNSPLYIVAGPGIISHQGIEPEREGKRDPRLRLLDDGLGLQMSLHPDHFSGDRGTVYENTTVTIMNPSILASFWGFSSENSGSEFVRLTSYVDRLELRIAGAPSPRIWPPINNYHLVVDIGDKSIPLVAKTVGDATYIALGSADDNDRALFFNFVPCSPPCPLLAMSTDV